MDALFPVKPHHARDAACALEAGAVLVARVRTIDGSQPVRAGRSDNRVHDRVPAVSRIDLIVFVHLADVRHGHLHRRRIVSRPEDQRLEPRRRLRDLAGPEKSLRAFDLGLDADPPREAAAHFNLRQQHADKDDILRQVRLGQHDEIEAVAGAFDHLDEIAVGKRRVETIDPERAHLAPEVEVAQRADDVGAARGLLVDCDSVLQVDAHSVGRARRRLRDHVRPRRRHVQHAALESFSRSNVRVGH